ncbi:RIP metalloprotease RseP [Pelagibaculum spongiae]|uniref:Zinc metalloprotease n=1 Tax=Pelagibaculum spongiae TaxID=2080658 RepID=A0A2V1GXK2_9GAMM|nr:RIP metalloprotease RseP [Pelagibaculum spongiae]PVZ64907.1 RIP metalloprotease RseP [Pelagibaculum spongiae]
MQTLIAFLLALGILVTIHEYGHFWVARKNGIKVLRFSIGFGKPLLRWNGKDGVEYVIAMLPLGGYVQMLGEDDEEVAEKDRHLAYASKSVAARMSVVLAGPIANLILAVVLYWIVFLPSQQVLKPVLGKVAESSLIETAGLQEGDQLLKVSGDEVVGWSDIQLQLLKHLGDDKPVEVLIQKSNSNVTELRRLDLSDWKLDESNPNILGDLGISPSLPKLMPIVGLLSDDGAAKSAGIVVNDQIVSLNGESIESWQDLVVEVRGRPDQKVQIEVIRNQQVQPIFLTLGSMEENGKKYGLLGAGVARQEADASYYRTIDYSPIEALEKGVERTWYMAKLTLGMIGKMLTGHVSPKTVSGPLSIAQGAGQAAGFGFFAYVGFLAYISLSLGVLNLLPVPVLDGGHAVLLGLEWLRGKPLSQGSELLFRQIGLFLILGLTALAIYNDIMRLI